MSSHTGYKPNVVRKTYKDGGRILHSHQEDEFDDQKLKEHYIQKYTRELNKAKRRKDSVCIKFYEAGIRYWEQKGRKLTPELKRLISDTELAIELAGGKGNLKKEIEINYNDKRIDFILNKELLGRDRSNFGRLHSKIKAFLSKKHKVLQAI